VGNLIAWGLASQAMAAFEGRRIDEAKELAGLGLAAAENVKCLYVLCSAFVGGAPALTAELARRMDDIADPADVGVRLNALRWWAEASLGRDAELGAANLAELEGRLRAFSLAHPQLAEVEWLLRVIRSAATSVPMVQGATASGSQIDDALIRAHRSASDYSVLRGGRDRAASHCAALLALKPDDADIEGSAAAGVLNELARAVLEEGGTMDDGGLARLATIAVLQRSPLILSSLMRRLWVREDLQALKAAAAISAQTPFVPTTDWLRMTYAAQIAAQPDPSSDRPTAERAARDTVIGRSDQLLKEIVQPEMFRVARSFFLLENQMYSRLWSDIGLLLEAMKTDKALEYAHAYAIARHVLYLNRKVSPEDMKRIAEYILSDERSTPDVKEFLFYYCARWGDMDLAYSVAEQLVPYRESWSILAYLKDFMDVASQTPAAIIGRPRTGKHVIYGNLVCWGKAFIEKMAWASLPSLIAGKNLPSLVKTNDVCIDLITAPEDVADLLQLEGVKRLSEYCEVRIYCFPKIAKFYEWAKDLPYVVFGHAQHFSILRAQQDGVDVMPLYADVVYADGCFEFVGKHVTEEPRALFCDGLNCAQTSLRAKLAPYRTNSVLTVDARTLTEFAVQAMKPILQHNFFQKSGGSIKTSTPSLIFRKAHGMRVYSFMQGVVYASAAALKGLTGFDRLTLEGTCSEVILANLTAEQVVVRTSADDVLWVELDDADRTELIPLGAEMVSHLDGVRNYFLRYARSLKRFTLFEMAVDYPAEGLAFGDVIDDATEAQFLADLQIMRENDPVFTELVIR